LHVCLPNHQIIIKSGLKQHIVFVFFDPSKGKKSQDCDN